MAFDSVITFMAQQAKALKEIEDLIAHDAKQNNPGHSVEPIAIKTLENYVTTMKYAVDTATALAEYYKGAEVKPEKAEKPKRTPAKKEDPPKEEPPKIEPVVEEFDFLD